MNTLYLQYIIIAVLVFAACYFIFRIIKKNFAPKKPDNERTQCDKNCGCS